MSPKKKHRDFESAIQRLEEITSLLESGDTSLEDSIKLYTEGLAIAEFCEKKLDEAEKKIKIIREHDGVMSEQEFDEDEAEK